MSKNYNVKIKKNQEDKPKEDIIEKLSDKKKLNIKFYKLAKKHKSFSGRKRIKECATLVMLKAVEDLSVKKLHRHNGCNDRLCPFCAGLKARKEAFVLSVLMKYIKSELRKDFIFLSLTSPNVKGENLKDEITKFNDAFKKLTKRKEVIPIIKGYARKLEITYNKYPTITKKMFYKNQNYYINKGLNIGDENPNYDTYHTHFHVLIAVNKSYFSGRTYINQETWLDLWRDCMGDQSITQVDVRKVSNDTFVKDGKPKNASLEIAKYSAKDSDYLHSQEVFDIFYDALKNRQVMTYNGLFKDAMKLYKEYKKISEDEKKNHVIHKYVDVDDNEYVYLLLYNWGHDEYVEFEKKEIATLTDEERRKFNIVLASDESKLP